MPTGRITPRISATLMLSDPDDVRATVTDPQGAVLVHLGSPNFVERFKVYVAHVQEWRAQFHKLQSVDLRYEHQVIVNPENAGVVARMPNRTPPPVWRLRIRRRKRKRPGRRRRQRRAEGTSRRWPAKPKTC